MHATVARVDDFEITGSGGARAWERAPWLPLSAVGTAASPYGTRARILYSELGLYFLFEAEDRVLTCTMTRDFDDIYKEDVIEVFLWPDERHPVYFEYEISPLNVELPILVANHNGAFMGWRPWHYEGDRRVRRATAVTGGPKEPLARVRGWSAEFFLPFALFRGLGNTPARAGTTWRANLYRIDYDGGRPALWAWCTETGGHFHDFRRFGTLRFGDREEQPDTGSPEDSASAGLVAGRHAQA
jgi:hypothetical protein